VHLPLKFRRAARLAAAVAPNELGPHAGGTTSGSAWGAALLDRIDVHGLRSLVTGLGLVGGLRPLDERTEADAGDGHVVDEEILRHAHPA
jgi:hypothetical protein